MLFSKEFWTLLWSLYWRLPQTSSSTGLHCFQVMVTLCDQLASTWARTAALLSHPSSFLSKHPSFCPNCKSDVFFLRVFLITLYKFDGRVQCLYLRKGRVAWDLGDGCPVAVPPSVTTQTTEQPSQVSRFVLGFSGELQLPLLCPKLSDYETQKS